MASFSLADQLEDAIEMMIAQPNSAPPKVDLNIGELLGIAAELRLIPDPEFKVALKAELLGAGFALPVVVPTTTSIREENISSADTNLSRVLPTLFGVGYGNYPFDRTNIALSMAMHAAVIAVVVSATLWAGKAVQPVRGAHRVLVTDVYVLPPSIHQGGGGGGGGDRDKIAESAGSLPRFEREQIAPPVVVVQNEQPKLVAEPTVIGPPALTLPTSQIGNPLSAILERPSNGPGFGGGIGSGNGGGIGSGGGAGVGSGHGGGTGGGIYRVGGGVSAPRTIYDPDPEYSEEARKAKYQGTVLLWLIVGADGEPRDIRVQHSLGMGLDERAIEAVRQWKFEPAMKDGQPVAVQVNIEISFRLY